eukprot:20223-Heterococcus_DN1.PRE.4
MMQQHLQLQAAADRVSTPTRPVYSQVLQMFGTKSPDATESSKAEAAAASIPLPDLDVNFVSFAATASTEVVDPHERLLKLSDIATAANPIGSTLLESVVFLEVAAFENRQRFPTFEECRESNSLVSGSGLKPTDRVLYISHRWIETAKTTATAAAASRTKQTADQSAVPIVTRPDDDLNLTYNLIRIYLSEATLPYTHIWVDCSCTDVRRMEGANGDAQLFGRRAVSQSILLVDAIDAVAQCLAKHCYVD